LGFEHKWVLNVTVLASCHHPGMHGDCHHPGMCTNRHTTRVCAQQAYHPGSMGGVYHPGSMGGVYHPGMYYPTHPGYIHTYPPWVYQHPTCTPWYAPPGTPSGMMRSERLLGSVLRLITEKRLPRAS